MFKHMKETVLAACLIPGMALAQLDVGDEMGASADAIIAALAAEGYETLEIEFEDGEIEVEAAFDGQLYEIDVSPETGLITEIELEDEDDDA